MANTPNSETKAINDEVPLGYPATFAASATAPPSDPVAWHEREKADFEAWWASRGDHKFGEPAHLAAGAAWFARASSPSSEIPAWISVKDRLPDDGVPVLVYPGWAAAGNDASIEEYCAEHGCFLMEIEDGRRVTHWQPLPAAPDSRVKDV